MKLPLVILFGLSCFCVVDKGNAEPQLTISQAEGVRFHILAANRLKSVYASANLHVVFAPYPIKRAIRNANSGITDGDVARVPLIEENFPNLRRVNVPIIMLSGASYIRRDRQDIPGDQISGGFVRGVKWAAEYCMRTHRICVIANDHIQLFRLLNAERIQVAYATSITADHLLDGMQDGRLAIAKHHHKLHESPAYHYLHKRNSRYIEQLEAAIHSLNGQWKD